MATRYRYSTCLSWGTDGEADYCELDVTVSYAVAWGSPGSRRPYFGPVELYDEGSPDEVEDIRLELVDGKPLTGCEFILPVLDRFEEEDDLRDAMLEEARQAEAAWGGMRYEPLEDGEEPDALCGDCGDPLYAEELSVEAFELYGALSACDATRAGLVSMIDGLNAAVKPKPWWKVF